jgi:bifunctional DNase/RNase
VSDVVDAADAPDETEEADGIEEIEEIDESPTFRVMELVDVRLDLPAQYPVVTLHETESPFRQLVFPVGLAEGTNLSAAVQRTTSPRPLSHEVLAEILGRFQIDVVAVRLTGRRGGTYLAELDLMGARGHEVVACRPTDGLNLALRLPVTPPILCDERLLEHFGDVEPGCIP